ncbi:MAG TPA: response regulator [Candidatus Binatia bacterium]|nr:response regulator [Candidatus Binatia bacterium]
MRALVIDDSQAIRILIANILKRIGFEVLEAANGREALERLAAASRMDVAFVDWNMPEMDGLAFVQAVRAEPRWAAVRLMMVTTETETAQVVRALAAGADEYLMKPFTKDALIEKLALLGIPARPDEPAA